MPNDLKKRKKAPVFQVIFIDHSRPHLLLYLVYFILPSGSILQCVWEEEEGGKEGVVLYRNNVV